MLNRQMIDQLTFISLVSGVWILLIDCQTSLWIRGGMEDFKIYLLSLIGSAFTDNSNENNRNI